MRDRRLSLRREALAELTAREIASLPAAASGLGCLTVTVCTGTTACTGTDPFSTMCTNGPCASDFQECNSHNCG